MIANKNCNDCGNCEFWCKRRPDGVFVCVNKKNAEDYMFPTSRHHRCDDFRREESY